jgi:hypothetical protein
MQYLKYAQVVLTEYMYIHMYIEYMTERLIRVYNMIHHGSDCRRVN